MIKFDRSSILSLWHGTAYVGHFGSGNGVADPYKEAADTLEQLAVLEFSLGQYSECADAIDDSIALVDMIWGDVADLSSRVPSGTATTEITEAGTNEGENAAY